MFKYLIFDCFQRLSKFDLNVFYLITLTLMKLCDIVPLIEYPLKVIFLSVQIFDLINCPIFFKYKARRLMGLQIIGSAAYCNQIWQAHLYINSAQSSSINGIIRLLLSLSFWPKVILLSGGHCFRVNSSGFWICTLATLLRLWKFRIKDEIVC